MMSYEDSLKTRLLQQECHFTWSLREKDFAVSDLLNRLDEQIQVESGEARVTRLYSSLGFVHYLHGNMQEALKNLQRSVQLAKEYYKEKSDEVLIVTYGDIAWLHYYMKEFSTCEEYLRLLGRINETFSEEYIYTVPLEVLREKGWAFLKFSWKYYNGAKECFRQALEINPDDSDLNRGYAITLYRKAGTSESHDSPTIKQLKKAIRLNLDDSVLLVLLALRRMQIKDDKKAYQSALELVISVLLKSPKNPYVIRYVAQFISQMGSVDEAIRLLEKALQDTPDSAFLHHKLAECYTKKNETLEKTNAECNEMYLSRCVYHLEKAIALKPLFIHALAELALQYGRQGFFSKAERRFDEAFKLTTNKKDHLPVVYCLFGQYQLWYRRSEEKAIYNFMQGLRLQPKSTEGKLCEINLRKIAEDRIQRLQNPHDSKANGIFGYIHEVKGEKLQAAEFYESALTHGVADGEISLLADMRIWLMSPQEAGKSVLKLIFDQGSYEEGLDGGGLKTVKGTMGKNIVNLVDIDIRNVKSIFRWEKLALNPGPHAVILVFPLDQEEFTDKTKDILEDLEFLGEKFWNHVMVVFTEGDSSLNEYHGTQGKVLKWLLDKCCRRYYISGSPSHTAEMGELSKKIQEMIQSNNSMHLLLPEVSGGNLDAQYLSEVLKGTDIQNYDLVTPKIIVQDGQTVYRVSCSRAGWFHCKFTKLGFNMKGEGEVVYSTVLQENSVPVPTNCYPAGPLYDIRCVQGEICQLKLPHCETSIEDGMDSMSVIHYSGDVEVLKPQNITSTHVTVSIPGTSKFRITNVINWFKEKIFGQVVLFYLQPTQKLHVFLQPNNVDPKKVADCDPNYKLIQTICECTLKYNRTYSMSCDSVEGNGPSMMSEIKIQPQYKKFCCTFEKINHYFPTFEIFLPSDVMNVRLSLKKEKPDPEKVKVVWHCEIHLKDYVLNKSVSSSTDEQCVAFLENNRCVIIQSVVTADAILDGLAAVIHPEQLNKIRAKTTPQEKTRAIYSFLDVQPAFTQRFFTLLKQNEPQLVADLMPKKSTGNFS